MTCLYCGKKLGFFSRYKDTPFCSEEHLRTHQDELERALMERLGSKTASPSRLLHELAEMESAPLKSMVNLDNATRAAESRPKVEPPAPAPAPAAAPPPAPAPVPAPAPPPQVEMPSPVAAKPPEEPAPAPLHEDYLFKLPKPAAALDTSKPLIPPASFAIIVHTDCCTPQASDYSNGLQLPFEEDSFEFEMESLLKAPAEEKLEAPLPQAFDEESFGEPWIEFPTTSFDEPSIDLTFVSDSVSLDYEPYCSSLSRTAMGHREEIAPRIRPRFPYAASQVTSTTSGLSSGKDCFAFTDSSEWQPVLPPEPEQLQPELPPPPAIDLAPVIEVKLSIGAMVNFNLDAADSEDFGDSLTVLARALAATTMEADYSAEDWSSRIALPLGATKRDYNPGWQLAVLPGRVAPVPFPSLFQLAPVIPPRPESSAG